MLGDWSAEEVGFAGCVTDVLDDGCVRKCLSLLASTARGNAIDDVDDAVVGDQMHSLTSS